ncbi:MAG TPA: tRNA (adenosine(37)-N6)-dimethylallyltransferase MiaA [Tepidisphaeraceae bacterium]|jgi:tRNA dimethylallyltransferase|nr:tRNA (adenosine(37)-N6)-dimethylallyltransferase MiaA [Tepidisphaeraceae bacterium]
MAVSQQKIVAIIGPTASGKSELALEIAKHLHGELLSVDSMQVYQHMDIGTGKPTLQEQQDVPHYLIDMVEPDKEFTVAKFVETADNVIARSKSSNIPIIAAGGTPLYFKALFEGLFEGPAADESIRDRLRTESGEALHQRLTTVDPEAATRIHANDTKRLIRALEVFEMTGKPISSFQTDWDSQQRRHDAIWIGLLWDKEPLNKRINARIKAMLSAGWLDETRKLQTKYGTLSKTAGEATGYRELLSHLRGEISLDDAVEQIKIGTRQLARRQMKWFRRFPNVHWIPGDSPLQEKLEKTLALYQ